MSKAIKTFTNKNTPCQMTSASACSGSIKNLNFYCPPVASSNEDADRLFDLVDEELKNLRAHAIKIHLHGGGELFVLPKFKTNEKELSSFLNNIHYNIGGGLRCNRCSDTLKNLLVGLGYLNDDGKLKLLFEGENIPRPYKMLSSPNVVNKNVLDKFEILDGNSIGIEIENGFSHFSFTPLDKSTFKKLSKADLKWYIRQMFQAHLNLINMNAEPGIIESLELLLKNLSEIPYGNKLIPATKWFLQVMKERMKLLQSNQDWQVKLLALRSMFNMPICRGVYPEKIVSTYLKQVKNNIVEALSSANNVPQLRALLKARFAPGVYMRPQKAATDHQLEIAMNLVGDLNISCHLMPLKNIENYNKKTHKLLTSHAPTEPTTANSIWASKRKKKTGAAGFASRANVNLLTPPNTFRELFDTTDGGLEIFIHWMNGICFATEFPNPAKKVFNDPNLWAFLNETLTSNSNIPYKKWVKVTGIIFLGNPDHPRSILFCLKGAKPCPDMKNTFFPSFVNPAYQRRLRYAFEDLNKYPLNISPDHDEFAIGIGTSRAYGKTRAIDSIKFRRDGKEVFHIDKFD